MMNVRLSVTCLLSLYCRAAKKPARYTFDDDSDIELMEEEEEVIPKKKGTWGKL